MRLLTAGMGATDAYVLLLADEDEARATEDLRGRDVRIVEIDPVEEPAVDDLSPPQQQVRELYLARATAKRDLVSALKYLRAGRPELAAASITGWLERFAEVPADIAGAG